jgi:hypothetical protein
VQAELTEIDTRVVRVDRRDQLELGILVHRRAHRGPHATAGTEDPDSDHVCA